MTPVDDRGDSTPLILGLILSTFQIRERDLQENIKIKEVERIATDDGRITALRFVMGSGTYYVHVAKETPQRGAEVDWDAQARFAKVLSEADPWLQEAYAAQTERWNDLLYSLAHLVGKPYEGETDRELVDMLTAKLGRTR